MFIGRPTALVLPAHGPELQHLEWLPVQARPSLPEQDRRSIESRDEKRDGGQERAEQEKGRERESAVEQRLQEARQSALQLRSLGEVLHDRKIPRCERGTCGVGTHPRK